MNEEEHNPGSEHPNWPGYIPPSSTRGFAPSPTQSTQPFGYGQINHMMIGMNMSSTGGSTPYYAASYPLMMNPYRREMIEGSSPPPGFVYLRGGSPLPPVL